jgi:ketosteroid isomerase-like protein
MMMRLRAAVIVACALASATVVVAQCSSTQEAQIKGVRDAWQTNWNAKQLDNVVALYAPDAVFLPSDGTRNTGTSEIKVALQKQLGSTVAISSVKVDCSGEFAYDSGSYTSDLPGGGTTILPNSTVSPNSTVLSGSKGKRIEGQYLVVLKHERGGSGMGGNAGMGGKAGIGGGGDIWRIVQHAATAKP